MKGIRLRTFVIFAVAALFGTALLHTSQRVQHAEDVLASAQEELAREQETMRMLRAEWEYLNRPERLERLAKKFLDLAPPSPDEMPDKLIGESDMLPDASTSQNDGAAATPVNYSADEAGRAP